MNVENVESLEVQKEVLERTHEIAIDMLINLEVKEEDINLQMDFFEIMRNENNN